MSSPPLRVFLTSTEDLTLFELKKALNVPARTRNRALILIQQKLLTERQISLSKRQIRRILKKKNIYGKEQDSQLKANKIKN